MNNRQVFHLIILLTLLIVNYTARKTNQDENDYKVFKQRRYKAKQLFNTAAQKRTFVKKGHSYDGLDRDEDNQIENVKRNIPTSAKKWPGGLVPYEISSDYTPERRTMILKAMESLTKSTDNCITFTPRTNHPNWILVRRGSACNSFVGMMNTGSQTVNMDENCGEKEMQHEILHALGFEHEQQRPDRDKYVRILFDNVQPNSRSQYFQTSSTDHFMLGEPYDFSSIMHYGYNFFSLNDLPVMVPTEAHSKEWRYNMANSTGLIPRDIRLVKKYYGCPL